jgi:hypothetical protein
MTHDQWDSLYGGLYCSTGESRCLRMTHGDIITFGMSLAGDSRLLGSYFPLQVLVSTVSDSRRKPSSGTNCESLKKVLSFSFHKIDSSPKVAGGNETVKTPCRGGGGAKGP